MELRSVCVLRFYIVFWSLNIALGYLLAGSFQTNSLRELMRSRISVYNQFIIMGNLQNNCCGSNELPTDNPQSRKTQCQQLINDDDYFYQEDWFGDETNFAPEKFIFNYPLYQVDQERMLTYWDKADLQSMRHGVVVRVKGQPLSSKWMYLIRKGTPCKHVRPIVLDLFKLTFADCNLQYKSALSVVFKNRDFPTSFKNVPLFGVQENDEEFQDVQETDRKLQLLIQGHMLSEPGIQALVRLLWVIHQQYHQVEYNPMLLQLAPLMLIFLKEEQAYCALSWMIEDSAKIQQDPEDAKHLRWHILLNQQQFTSFAESFYETVAQRSKTFAQIFQHFKDKKFDYIELFHDMTTKLFTSYLPFNMILKIFTMFMNEGIKIYYRISYAIVRVLKDEILNLNYPAGLKYMIRKRMLNLTLQEQDMLIKKAFALRLVKQTVTVDAHSTSQKIQTYYLPNPSQPSNIIAYEEFETIWEWLPSSYKLCDPHLVFSTLRDGYSLKNLVKSCSSFLKWPVLLIIMTQQQTTFGVFCDVMIQRTPKHLGTNDSFVFMMRPDRRKFAATGKNSKHLICGEKSISFGDEGDGVAIQLDDDLYKGLTQRSDTYDNLRFNGDFAVRGSNRFQCLGLEAYAIQ